MTVRGQRPKVEPILSRLKGFQRATVEYAFERLYIAPDSTRRFLVADEVGLGKTLVARGLIAKAIDHMWETVDRIDVVYICSNGNIARQNINRLRVDGQREFTRADRLTMLPTTVHHLNHQKVNYLSFTPGTSFDLKSSLGRSNERVLLYYLIREVWPRSGTAPLNLLQGNMYRDNFRSAIKDFDAETIDADIANQFAASLEELAKPESKGGKNLRSRYLRLCDQFVRSRKNIPSQQVQNRNRLVGDLRSALAMTCVKALEPDLVILDEFQRFKVLLDKESGSEASFLANELFTYSDKHAAVRLLLLSATPYKMYTLHHETQDDDHYQDFLRTVEFLDPDLGDAHQFRNLIDQHRRNLYRIVDELDPAELCKSKTAIETRLRRVMSRTERVRVGDAGDGMIREHPPTNMRLEPKEVRACVGLQRVGAIVEQPQVLEYWKSSPYLLSFMDKYKLKQEVMERATKRLVGKEVREVLLSAPDLFLPWDQVEQYSEVNPANARLRSIVADEETRGGLKLLWVPPSLPYYEMSEAFEAAAVSDFTKRLMFSTWAVVPKTAASFLSYEAERRIFRESDPNAVNTPEARKNRKPLLKFAFSQERLTGMPVLGILYPSPTLAAIGDPLELQKDLRGSDAQLPIRSILEQIRNSLEAPLTGLARRFAKDGREDERWYWAAPILLDLYFDKTRTEAWFDQWDLARHWAGLEKDDDEDSRWNEHVARARELVHGELEPGLGRPPEDLVDVVATIALSGPAVCALRALARQSADKAVIYDPKVRTAAARVGWGFRSLFNMPEVMALLRGQEDDDVPYWRRVLDYCAAGCLQSVLDEYCHVLYDLEGLDGRPPMEACEVLSRGLFRSLTLRTASLQIDEIQSIDGGEKIRVIDRRMRTHFAVRFGHQETEDGTAGAREDQVRTAFNSPFWPHVLTTTSVGQEGLDFHAYCHAVVHWNLPSNPVDLEQREGRVHRFKGHAIRKNVARVFGSEALAKFQGDIWQRVFELAEENTEETNGGLVPFWVYPTEGGSYIERHVPRLALSRDDYQLEALRRSLAVYRMVFGQPRQEDLLAYLLERVPKEKLEELRPLMQIDLSPPDAEGTAETLHSPPSNRARHVRKRPGIASTEKRPSMDTKRYRQIFEAFEETLLTQGGKNLPREKIQSELNRYRTVQNRLQSDDECFRQLVAVIFYSGMTAKTVTDRLSTIHEHFPGHIQVLGYDESRVSAISADERMIRNPKKISAAVKSARVFANLVEIHGSFKAYLTSFGSPESSEGMSALNKDLDSRFPGLGPITAFHLMSELGLPVLKPDRVIMRIFTRLGLMKGSQDPLNAIEAGRRFVEATDHPIRYIDIVIVACGQVAAPWFGIERGICVKNEPECSRCLASRFCDYYSRKRH